MSGSSQKRPSPLEQRWVPGTWVTAANAFYPGSTTAIKTSTFIGIWTATGTGTAGVRLDLVLDGSNTLSIIRSFGRAPTVTVIGLG